MATNDVNLADRSGNLIESHKGYDPRIVFFYFILAALLLTLVGGLAWQQLGKTGEYADAERQQNQRRVLFPGPRGNIYDRNGRVLVENRHRFAVLLHLDELKAELRREHIRIYKNYVAAGTKKDVPSDSQLKQIARVTLVQRYLDQVNEIVGRTEKVDATDLRRHFDRQLLLPYSLLDNLTNTEYARLIERLPVRSPLEVYASNIRSYPHDSAAAHILGYVRPDNEVEAEGFPGEDLTTFKMRGTRGKDGLENWFDAQLQGEAGGRIYRVDPTGFKINKPLAERKPKQGKHLTTSIDIDLQLVAEKELEEQRGAVVALDVNTGEVLVLANAPSYNLNDFYPRLAPETYKAIQEKGAEFNYAVNGRLPPGSTFKILTSIASLRNGTITPDEPIIDCDGVLRRFNGRFVCYNGREHHHEILLGEAIAHSCDIYFYEAGWRTTPDMLAAEGRRFHLDQRTGIELPHENGRLVIPDPDYKQRVIGEKWYPGDTANMSIGQGFVLLSPLQMACFVASVARGQVYTKPTLVHQADRPVLRNESIGLTPAQRKAILDGMEGCVAYGTGKTLTTVAELRIPGVNILGKTGTAQYQKKNIAWFIAFAPREKPEIAIAVAIEGDTPGEEFGGGRHAGPVAAKVIKRYFEKKNQPPPTRVTLPLKTE